MTSTTVTARPEGPADVAAIRRINELAFGRAEEADIVDALRAAGAVVLSLVAVDDVGVAGGGGEIVGHILFSPVRVDRAGSVTSAVGLAPMAVHPARQREGLGSLLVREGLDRLREAGAPGVVVLGHPAYYPRFGFARASQLGLRWEHPCPEDAFMALELRPGGLGERGVAGVVRYRPELGAA